MTRTTHDEQNGMRDNADFSADWLRQREPFDLAARSAELASCFKAALSRQPSRPPSRQARMPARGPSGTAALRLIDLAAGSGANFRALAPTLATDQAWTLVDHDPLLLAAQRTEIARWAAHHGWHCVEEAEDTLVVDTGLAHWRVRGQALDLARDLERVDLNDCDGLVTTAFLDLVSANWLDRLCAMLTDTPRPFLATLTVDGRRIWRPPHPVDAHIDKAFLAHQGGDKDFGPSLGVQAVPYLGQALREQGWRVSTAPSDWRIGPAQRDMLTTLARETATVATMEAAAMPPLASRLASSPLSSPDHKAAFDWLADRSAGIERGQVSLQIGHLDLLAIPA